jgi:hypothetical protein
MRSLFELSLDFGDSVEVQVARVITGKTVPSNVLQSGSRVYESAMSVPAKKEILKKSMEYLTIESDSRVYDQYFSGIIQTLNRTGHPNLTPGKKFTYDVANHRDYLHKGFFSRIKKLKDANPVMYPKIVAAIKSECLRKIPGVDTIYDILRVFQMDFYTTLRMFTKFKPGKEGPEGCQNDLTMKNIIFYGGGFHVLNMAGIFLELGYIPTKRWASDSEPENYLTFDPPFDFFA